MLSNLVTNHSMNLENIARRTSNKASALTQVNGKTPLICSKVISKNVLLIITLYLIKNYYVSYFCDMVVIIKILDKQMGIKRFFF